MDKKELEEYIEAGETLASMSTIKDVSISTIRHYLRKYGLKTKLSGHIRGPNKLPEIKKICKYHGETTYYLQGRNSYRCKKCNSERSSVRRRKVKELALDYLGSRCSICDYDKSIWALEFHHLYGKDFSIGSKGYARAWHKVKEELDKCVLLCSNCHREQHEKEFKEKSL